MPFQKEVRLDQASGIIGEKAFEGPSRALRYLLNSQVPENNVFGRAFTIISGVDSQNVQAGGAGTFAGIMAHPKQHASYGDSAGTLAPTLQLENGQGADFATMDELWVSFGSAKAAQGDVVAYLIADSAPGANDAGTLIPHVPGDTIPATERQILGAEVIRCDTSTDGLAVIKLTDQIVVNPTA